MSLGKESGEEREDRGKRKKELVVMNPQSCSKRDNETLEGRRLHITISFVNERICDTQNARKKSVEIIERNLIAHSLS